MTGSRPPVRVLDRDETVRRFGPGRRGTLVFTNGCFDLLHRGHLELLTRAAGLGDALLVGVNSDDSVRRLKGEGRPVTAAADRVALLAALRPVDAVTVFEEDTPLELIRALRPDVLVKGGDYERPAVVGGDDVEGWGGRVVLVPLVPVPSTTAMIERLRG